jgi:hypothetical protein
MILLTMKIYNNECPKNDRKIALRFDLLSIMNMLRTENNSIYKRDESFVEFVVLKYTTQECQ